MINWKNEIVTAVASDFDNLANDVQTTMKVEVPKDTHNLEHSIDKNKVNETTYEVGVLDNARVMHRGVNYAQVIANGRGAIALRGMVFHMKDGKSVQTQYVKGVAPNDFVGRTVSKFK